MSVKGLERDLLQQPWVEVCLGGTPLLAKSYFGDNTYQLLLSDTNNVWEEEVDEATIEDRAQELNKRLRAPVGAFFSNLRTVVHPYLAGEADTAVERNGDSISLLQLKPSRLTLRLKSELAGVPFYWEFRCSSSSEAVVCSQLVRPLLAMTLVLQRQAEELAVLLARKDAEIQDYKESGTVLSRERLQTEVFDLERYRKHFIAESLPMVCRRHDGLGFSKALSELYAAVTAPSAEHRSAGPEKHSSDRQCPDSGSPKKRPGSPLSPGEQQGGEQDGTESGTGVPQKDHKLASLEEPQREQTVPLSPALASQAPPRPKKKKAVGLFR